jgi:hypothetical protein
MSGISASVVQDVRGVKPRGDASGLGELLPAAILIWVVGVALMVWRFRYAPEGYEDDAGFHYGREASR